MNAKGDQRKACLRVRKKPPQIFVSTYVKFGKSDPILNPIQTSTKLVPRSQGADVKVIGATGMRHCWYLLQILDTADFASIVLLHVLSVQKSLCVCCSLIDPSAKQDYEYS